MREQIRDTALVIVVIGVLVMLVSIFADPLALGTPHTGFGWKQMLGTAFGAIVAGAGLWWHSNQRRQ